MSDLNNPEFENDDTSMLFVSGQRKKKAEEEAQRKIEEEEARKLAAQEEARRLEAEMEERKKKAEEERIALENAMKEEALKAESIKEEALKKEEAAKKEAAEAAKALKQGKKEGKSNKMPLFIGIGAAVVVAVVALVVVLLVIKNGGPKFDYSNVDFNASYASKKDGMDIEFSYPDELYPDVSERTGDSDNLIIHFTPEKEKEIKTDVVLRKILSDSGNTEFTRNNSAFWSPDSMTQKMISYAAEQLNVIVPDAEISDEEISEFNEDKPGTYCYKFNFASEEVLSGAAACWFEPASDDTYKFILVSCSNAKEGIEAVQTLRDDFYAKNSDGALGMPGANPLESASTDGMIQIDSLHMGLHVPNDRFVRYPKTIDFDMFIDENGAYLYVVGQEADLASLPDELPEEMMEDIEDMAECETPPGFECTERTKITNEWVRQTGYKGEYTEKIGGVSYWERTYVFDWQDLQTGKTYWARIVLGCPAKDKDVYGSLIDYMFGNMEDI
ncbi:MAG: hypothetical protein K5888_03735 [Lachnospiraceae bacterium]|nr:hypothetical protein [Lachnospiraceae bacterium]